MKQTGGDLSSSAIIDAFHTQLKADVAAKTFTLLVGSKKRKKRATTLTSDGNLASEAEAGCPSGSGTVGTSCSKSCNDLFYRASTKHQKVVKFQCNNHPIDT